MKNSLFLILPALMISAEYSVRMKIKKYQESAHHETRETCVNLIFPVT